MAKLTLANFPGFRKTSATNKQNASTAKSSVVFNITTETAKRVTVNEQEYLQLPANILKTGVEINGLHYGAEVQKAYAAAWNDRAVTLRHPGDKKLVRDLSFNERETITVGRVADAEFTGEVTQINAYIPVANINGDLADLEDTVFEVSTGLELVYDTATNEVLEMFPDHLALLPDETGACSVADGCGTRVNVQNSKCRCTALPAKQYNTEDTVETIRQALETAIRATMSDDDYFWISDISADLSWVVYEKKDVFYKISFTYSDSVATLSGNPVEVVREYQYTEKGETMEKEKPAQSTAEQNADGNAETNATEETPKVVKTEANQETATVAAALTPEEVVQFRAYLNRERDEKAAKVANALGIEVESAQGMTNEAMDAVLARTAPDTTDYSILSAGATMTNVGDDVITPPNIAEAFRTNKEVS